MLAQASFMRLGQKNHCVEPFVEALCAADILFFSRYSSNFQHRSRLPLNVGLGPVIHQLLGEPRRAVVGTFDPCNDFKRESRKPYIPISYISQFSQRSIHLVEPTQAPPTRVSERPQSCALHTHERRDVALHHSLTARLALRNPLFHFHRCARWQRSLPSFHSSCIQSPIRVQSGRLSRWLQQASARRSPSPVHHTLRPVQTPPPTPQPLFPTTVLAPQGTPPWL